MRPEKVFDWREQLPPPFDKSSAPLRRRGSAGQLDVSIEKECVPLNGTRERRASAPDALDQVDRNVNWLRFIHRQHVRIRRGKGESALIKLRR